MRISTENTRKTDGCSREVCMYRVYVTASRTFSPTTIPYPVPLSTGQSSIARVHQAGEDRCRQGARDVVWHGHEMLRSRHDGNGSIWLPQAAECNRRHRCRSVANTSHRLPRRRNLLFSDMPQVMITSLPYTCLLPFFVAPRSSLPLTGGDARATTSPSRSKQRVLRAAGHIQRRAPTVAGFLYPYAAS